MQFAVCLINLWAGSHSSTDARLRHRRCRQRGRRTILNHVEGDEQAGGMFAFLLGPLIDYCIDP